MRVFLAMLVGFTLIHDGLHVFRCAKVSVGHRLPLFLVSSATAVLRSVLVSWAYLTGRMWLAVVGAGLGGLVIHFAYAFDRIALQKAVEIANVRAGHAEASD